MAEIAKVRKTGLKVASTFAGCGGSSLGYRMAGFEVVWANEFVDAARAVYEANKSPGTIVDGRDIRKIRPEEVLSRTKLKRGELDVLDGSPPCSDFSTAGKRSEGWGRVKKYSDVEQRVDDLFFEFVRMIDGLKPKVFVAENVSGLIKGVAKGYFIEIMRAMRGCGYDVEARLLDAQWLGVPQQRQRVIFVGTRIDLNVPPAYPAPFAYRYSIRDALGLAPFQFEVEREADISGQAIGKEYDRLNPGQSSEKYFNLVRSDASAPSPTITASGGQNSGIACAVHPTEKRKFSIAELKRLCAFPDDFVLTGSYAQQWERLGRAVPPLMMRAIAEAVRDRVLLRARSAAPARGSRGRSTSG